MPDFATIFTAAFAATVIMANLWYWPRRFRMTAEERRKQDEEMRRWNEVP
jgi:hypothetical protein